MNLFEYVNEQSIFEKEICLKYTNTFGRAHVILVHITFAQKHPLVAQYMVLSWAGGLHFGSWPFIDIHTSTLCMQAAKGLASLCRFARSFAARQCAKGCD